MALTVLPLLGLRSSLSFLVIATCLLVAAGVDDGPLRIDCGNLDRNGMAAAAGFTADQYTSDGTPFGIAPGSLSVFNVTANLSTVEATGRAFPTGGCYKIPRADGTYLARLGFAYFNYDQQSNPPIFNVTAQGVPVLTINLLAVEMMQGNETGKAATAHYRDFIAYTNTGYLDICLVPFSSAYIPSMRGHIDALSYPLDKQSTTPLLNTLEVYPTPPTLYQGMPMNSNVILSNAFRVNFGGPAVGPDKAGRVWSADDQTVLPRSFRATNLTVNNTDVPSDYLPLAVMQRYREAVNVDQESSKEIRYSGMVVPMDPSNTFVVFLTFAEPSPSVKPGQRVMQLDLMWNDGFGFAFELVPRIVDIANDTKPLTALVVPRLLQLSTPFSYAQWFSVVLRSSNNTLPAVISAMELYEAILDTPPVPDAAAAPTAAPAMTLTAEKAYVMSPPPPPPEASSGLSAGSIAAIVLGVILALVLVAGGVYFFVNRKQNPRPFARFDETGAPNANANLVV